MSATLPLTIEEYDRLIGRGVFSPRGGRFELLHGEIIAMSPIGPPHEEVVDLLTKWSILQLAGAPIRVRVQQSIGFPRKASAPEPDLAWVKEKSYAKRRPQVRDVLLIVEVAETSLGYDRREKLRLYASAGIQEYWIVNLIDECLEIYRQPEKDRYTDLRTCRGDDVIEPSAWPSAKLTVSELF